MSRKYQVLIHDANGTNFAKGTLTAVIQDARDIGVQLYANDTGSAFWTLPVTHPVLPLIKPLEQHYTIQRQNDSGVYESIAGGFISDYDASKEEVVISGVDYMTVLDKYYTPLQGPSIGDTPVKSTDVNLGGSVDLDEESDTGDTTYHIISDLGTGDQPYLARPVIYNSSSERNKVNVSINNDGRVTVSGTVKILRAKASDNKVQVGTSAFPSGGAPAVLDVGVIIYANPGGPVANVLSSTTEANHRQIRINSEATHVELPFSVAFDTSEGSSSGSALTGSVKAVLYKGITYSFSAKAYYNGTFCRMANGKQYQGGVNTGADDIWNDIDPVTGALENADPATGQTSGLTSITANSPGRYFAATIWGQETRQSTTTQTSGLKKKNLPGIMDEIYALGANGVIDRTNDYAGSSGTLPVSLLRWDVPSSGTGVTHINQGTSTFVHPYISFGQSPVELMREVADQEMGQRGTDPSQDVAKVVFNYFGVPGQTTVGEFTVNHNVSTTPVATYVYPGTVKDFNVVNKRSILANSVRILPSTEFLLGSATDAPAGTKTKGVVKSTRTLAYAIPYIEAQGGFINSTSAGNYAQGILNDRGSVEDTRMVSVQLRNVNPIGATGGPRLGECVKLVVNRKSVTTNGTDLITSNYNVGGMQLIYRIDGYEQIFFDLVKPARFKGPGITFETPGTPKPKDKAEPEKTGSLVGTGDDAVYKQKVKTVGPVYAADGRTLLPTPGTPEAMRLTGTSYMWAGTVGGRTRNVGLPKKWWTKITPTGR